MLKDIRFYIKKYNIKKYNIIKKNSHKGMSAIEGLVALGIATILSLTIATMIENMFIENKKVVLKATLTELKRRIEANIRDESAWSKTMNANGFLTTCFNTTTSCTAVYTPTTDATKIILRDGANNVAFDLLNWAGTGSNGFTEGGTSCTAFSAVTGVDTCPISYRLVANLLCPANAASCVNPQLKITGRLIFNPGTAGTLNKFRRLIAVGSLTSTAVDANDAKYDIAVKRAGIETNRTFRLVMQYPFNTSASALTTPCDLVNKAGVGVCSTAGLAIHPLNWTELTGDDPYNLVTGSGTQSFQLAENGPYACTITVPTYSSYAFTAVLHNNTNNIEIARALTSAGSGSTSYATIRIKFIGTTATDYILRQSCESLVLLQAPNTAATFCSLGFVSPSPANGTLVTMVTMHCFKVDKNL